MLRRALLGTVCRYVVPPIKLKKKFVFLNVVQDPGMMQKPEHASLGHLMSGDPRFDAEPNPQFFTNSVFGIRPWRTTRTKPIKVPCDLFLCCNHAYRSQQPTRACAVLMLATLCG